MEITLTGQQYIYCFIAGMLGILFHIFVIKLPATKARAIAANLPFRLSDYFRDDWVAIGASVITVLICVFALDELVGYHPAVINKLKYVFFFVGFTGSSILIAVLGKAGKAINSIIDIKTDIADGKSGNIGI